MSRFLLWLALAISGQIAALSMISAGNQLRYQHYPPINRHFIQDNSIAIVIVSIQLVAVFVGLWIYKQRIAEWLGSSYSKFTLIAAALVFGLTSATVSPGLSLYVSELAFAAFIQLINLGNIILVAISIPEDWTDKLRLRFDGLLGTLSAEATGLDSYVDRFAGLAAIWVFAIGVLLSFFVYQRHPHVPDEAAYYLQARYLASGKLITPVPPVPEAFNFYLMQFDGDYWYPSPPVGWPAMLAIGAKFGVPWLVNPVLAGINILLIYWIIKALYNRRSARITVLLFCLSPWYLFMAMNYMTHIFTLTCALAATLWVMRCRETGRMRWGVFAGLALGVMSLIRPLESLIMAGLLGAWSIGLGGKRLKYPGLISLVLVTGLVSLLVLPYNDYLTGDPFNFPINQYTDQQFGANSNAYGFGQDRGMGWPFDPNPGHSPIDGLININLNAFSLNIELFGWSIGSLLLVALFVFSFRYQKSDYLMLAVILTVVIIFFPYYFSGGPDFGARYWFLIIVPLVALTVRGIQSLEERIAEKTPPDSSRVLSGIFIMSLMGLFLFIPWRATDKYYHYQGMRPDIKYLSDENVLMNNLVLITGSNHPDYVSAAVYNPIDINTGDTIYAWDFSPEVRAKVIEAYPDRQIWLVDGPTITHDGYRITAGPLTASEVLFINQSNQ